MLQDVNLKPNSVTREDIQEISKLIFQEGKKVIQNMQREVDKITIEKNEEVLWLKDHSEKLLTQIRKLKKDKKLLENKVQQLVENKASNVEVQIEEKTNIDPVNVTTQEEVKQVVENTKLDVAVQMRNILSQQKIQSQQHPRQKKIKKIITHLIRESQIKKAPYRHPNHRSRQLDQANVDAIHSCDNKSSQVASHRIIP